MKKLFFILAISTLVSCGITKNTTNVSKFPINFDEAEAWFDAMHSKEIVLGDGTVVSSDTLNLVLNK